MRQKGLKTIIVIHQLGKLFAHINTIGFLCFVHRSIDHCHNILLRNDSLGPYNSILEMQSYASTLAKQRVSPPDIVWSYDRSRVSYKGNELVLDHMRRGLYDMERQVITAKDDIALNQQVLYNVPDKLIDNMSNSAVGYSWLDNARFTENDHALLKLLLDDPNCAALYFMMFAQKQ